MLRDNRFAGTNNHFDIRGIAAIYNIFFGQQVSGRNNDSTEFMQSYNAEPEFKTTFQYQHYHVTMTDAEALEIRSCHVRIAFHVGKRKLVVFTLIISP